MKKIPVWKNVALIVSVIVVLIIATFAWFYFGTSAWADDLALDVGQASFVQISGDNGTHWSEELDLEFGVSKNFKELSGDGINLFAPVYDEVENSTGGFSTQIVGFKRVTDNKNCYEQVFSFRSDSLQNIYLDPASYVTCESVQDNAYIDGAIRVAFIELDENGNETLRCIWAPNSGVEYTPASNSFTREGMVEERYFYQKSTIPVDVNSLAEGVSNPHVVQIPTGYDNNVNTGCGYNANQKFMWSNDNQLPHNAPVLLTVPESMDEGAVYKKMKIKVWLEGHDRECVSLLSGQKFSMKFQFIAEKGE